LRTPQRTLQRAHSVGTACARRRNAVGSAPNVRRARTWISSARRVKVDMDSAQHADADMQRAQRTANGRNSGHNGTRQAQTEASAHTPNRIDTACKKDERQQAAQTQTTHQQNPHDPRTRSHTRNGKISARGGATDEQVEHRPDPWGHPPDPWGHPPEPWGHPPDPRARWTSNRAQLTLAQRRESGTTTTAGERPSARAKTWQER
jgi:hypothetical protein